MRRRVAKKKLHDWTIKKPMRGTTEKRLRSAVWKMGYDMIVVVGACLLVPLEYKHE